ncbi:MAG TPA: hypothetical protein VJB66_00265 [Candidatus Nanoarchaeia archaeon]|nr:hypothetical protein [Candidatus Nanoarchaeia archaeon]
MGIFHKALSDVEGHLKKGNLQEARIALGAHIEKEHGMNAAINQLVRDIHTYQNSLFGLQNNLLASTTNKPALAKSLSKDIGTLRDKLELLKHNTSNLLTALKSE